jgi:hypothetical protein
MDTNQALYCYLQHASFGRSILEVTTDMKELALQLQLDTAIAIDTATAAGTSTATTIAT